ncbi:MAG: phosphopantetheine-binding protein [Clostridiales bacterium]|nr:phosphopantetheine-binding protein [Clostridiales bacterium]MCI6433891.1 phosphopantetheine-binding protein [Clostridiales bacterium]
MDTVLEIIQDCCEEVDPSLITEESRFLDDLELSSLDFFSLISEIESEFNIHITELEIQRLVTVGDLLHVLQEKGV